MGEAWRLLRDTVRDWYGDRAQRLGAALAFYTLFALAPGLVILIPLTGVFLGPQAAQGHIVERIGFLIGRSGAEAIEVTIVSARESGAGVTIVAVVVAVVSLGLLALLLTRTRIGLQMRAAATDFGTARLLGVRANTVISVAVLLSALLAAAVAVILTVQNPLVSPDFALKDTIIVLVGVVVGGIDRLWTAMLGGFAIGFVTGVINGALPTDKTVFLPSLVFALVIVVLLIRPAGLFARGRAGVVERL